MAYDQQLADAEREIAHLRAQLAEKDAAMLLLRDALMPFVLWFEEGMPPEPDANAAWFAARDAITQEALGRASELDRARREVLREAAAMRCYIPTGACQCANAEGQVCGICLYDAVASRLRALSSPEESR